MTTTIVLSEEIAGQAMKLANRLGISVDELSAMAIEALVKKYDQATEADLELEQKMAIARHGIHQYQQALMTLAQ